tara:strand:- start:196 stop:1416 length:1221 start_codon:yes stop_codon:yes gene_type:complete
MAKKEQEQVTETPVAEEPKLDNKVEKLKVKKKPKMKQLNKKDEVIKVDFSQKPEENEPKQEVTDNNTNDEGVVANVEDTGSTQEQKEVQPEKQTQETPILEDVSNEEIVEQKAEEIAVEAEKAIKESVEEGIELPESVEKLLQFMEETGGDLKDYVRLNQDYSEYDDNTLLREYYKQTKPHLNSEEVDFLMEDTFSYDEEVDEEKDIKRKKLALKEQVAQARQHLDSAKSKYYEDIKAGSKLTTEQQKAVDFFNRYNNESEERQKIHERSQSIFDKKTNEVFNQNFKGFEYNVGDKRYRYNVNNINDIKQSQSDITNFIKKFLNNNNEMEDAKGYHKSMFTAMNADAIANHFYEQGKADALKDSISKSKNIDMDPRQAHTGEFQTGGVKFKVVGENSNDFKFKIKK